MATQQKQASPAQQQQFDMLLGRARQLMASAGEQWIQALKADPVQAAVTFGVATLRKLAGMSTKAGTPVDPAVLFNVGINFIKDIAGVANAAGAVPDEQLPQYLKEVFSQSMAEYLKLDAKEGMMPKAEAQGMLAKMQGGSPAEPAGEGPGPDNLPAHEQAETPAVEQQEGPEEDSPADDPEMAAQLAALRAKRGA